MGDGGSFQAEAGGAAIEELQAALNEQAEQAAGWKVIKLHLPFLVFPPPFSAFKRFE